MADLQRVGLGERDTDQAITALKKGAYLLKYGRRGKPKFCPFRLSTNSRNAGSSKPEQVGPKFQDMLHEADELARPKSIPTRTPSFRLNRRYQEVRDGRSAEVSEREPMGMQIQDKRNEADESTLPKSLPARAPPFRRNQAVRYGRSADAKESEAVETKMQAEVAQDERKTDESKKKMNEIDESTLPNSLAILGVQDCICMFCSPWERGSVAAVVVGVPVSVVDGY
ncbi:hypothetical protein RJ640_007843 [Escallonia rubra]|uniref:Uncharacterized protein n=1 Tax=Escallonia rubra TaxID=112253 RepID=A0AA88S247_9ASTE|nr:hypothetical protein RJ640_007843 [Escallonia rubra]